jgi:tetratricopeptide (TPR) repeat protein
MRGLHRPAREVRDAKLNALPGQLWTMSGRRDQNGRDGRAEPTLGDLGDLDAPHHPRADDPDDRLPRIDFETPRRAPPVRHRRLRLRSWHLLLLVLVLVLGGGAWMLYQYQNSLREMVPRTELNDVLSRADKALQDGRLDGTDGTSARELYQAARALEPDNDRARDGLHQVGMAELSRADTAYRAGRLDEAQRELGVARELLGGGTDVDRLGRLIEQARGAAVPADGLVAQAQQALAAGKLTGPDGAGTLYQRMLAADPNNAVARHGLDQVGAALANQARAALAHDDPNAASTTIDQLAALLPTYGDLPELRAALAQAQQKDDGALLEAISQGQQALRDGRISGAGDDTALAHFQAALKLDPDNPQARAGLGQVAQALVVQANAALDADDTAQASGLLDQAEALAPKSADLAAARARLRTTLAQAQPAPPQKSAPDNAAPPQPAPPSATKPSAPEAEPPPPPPPALTADQIEQVAELVRRARTAASQGQIMLPPGESAYDLYRNALAIDGNNQAALQGLEDLPNLVVQQFNQALSGGRLDKAGELLGALGDLSPGDSNASVLRSRLVDAWLDQAEQQLDRGDRANAAQSIAQARKLAPYQPRVTELSLRLQSGH